MGRILYERAQLIGSGTFGKVFKAVNKISGAIYALKVIKCYSNEQMKCALDESKLMSQLVHVNIVKLLQLDLEQPTLYEAHICLLFEYCAGGNLNDRLQRKSTQELNYLWMKQLASGLAYMHYNNIVHRDIKPANILLTEWDHIKIGDFGTSRKYLVNSGANLSTFQMYMVTLQGTPCFASPEVYRGHYTEKTDIFSLGLVFYCIQERRAIIDVHGKIHYGLYPSLASKMNLMEGDFFPLFQSSKQVLVNLIISCLRYDFKKRPSAAWILNYLTLHSWH